uniref:Uncharacterized protein n=1 Tax=Fagus sylvatica TaxID=28930 RepID=A0A2N9GVU6_FAGSY
MTTVGMHRWGAGQSSSDGFVRDLGRMIIRPRAGVKDFNLGDFVSSDSVLRRVSEELFDLASPALDTWRVVKGLMVAERDSWSSVHSEDLPEGLSERDGDTRSTEETPSVSGSSKAVGPDDSWIARYYLSKVVNVDGLDSYRRKYQIPEDVVLRIPESDEVACSSKYGDVAFYEADFNAGVRFPMQPLMRELLDHLNLAPGQLAPNALEDGCGLHGDVEALRRPKLNEDGHNRVLRALHHKQHHYKHFIRPELLALYSFGPEPSEDVLSLQEINKKRMATAKLNREKLKKMMMMTDERNLPPPPAPKPSAPEPVPTSSVEVVEIPAEPSSSRFVEKSPTLPRDASLACRRAKAAVTKDDLAEYDKVNTDVIKVAGVHSLMKGLTELTVIANRCTQWEEALLEAEDSDASYGFGSRLDLTRKDEDLRRALDDVKRADEQVKKLTSQLEVAKVSAVEDFNFLKKQAKEKYPELDFEAFQPFDDDESVMPVGDDNAGPSTDPQMDDDATS